MKINIEKYNKALNTKGVLEQEIKEIIAPIQAEIELLQQKITEATKEQTAEIDDINKFIEMQNELIDKELKKSSKEENYKINEKLFRSKKFGQTIDTEKFLEEIKKSIIIFGEQGEQILSYGIEKGSRISLNRTNLVNSLKEKAKELNISIIDLIKTAELNSSKQTINIKTVIITE